MEKKTFILAYFIKETKLLQNGEAPIYARLTISKERVEWSLYRSIAPKLWDKKKERVRGANDLSQEINSYLENVRNKIYECYLTLEKKGEEITSKSLKHLFVFGETKEQIGILDYMRQYIDRLTKLVGIDISPSTIQRYNITYKLFSEYLNQDKGKGEKKQDYLSDITESTINEFIYYLKSVRKCQHNTVVKYVRGVARIFREAIKEGKIELKEEDLNLSIRAEEHTLVGLTMP